MFIFVTRHKGAIEWARRHGVLGTKTVFAKTVPNLTEDILSEINEKYTIVGDLPVHIAARVCAKGARFFYLDIGDKDKSSIKELTANEMEMCGTRIIEYRIEEGSVWL